MKRISAYNIRLASEQLGDSRYFSCSDFFATGTEFSRDDSIRSSLSRNSSQRTPRRPGLPPQSQMKVRTLPNDALSQLLFAPSSSKIDRAQSLKPIKSRPIRNTDYCNLNCDEQESQRAQEKVKKMHKAIFRRQSKAVSRLINLLSIVFSNQHPHQHHLDRVPLING